MHPTHPAPDTSPLNLHPEVDRRPHSRACGIREHRHGSACSTNCPTCHGSDSEAAVSPGPPGWSPDPIVPDAPDSPVPDADPPEPGKFIPLVGGSTVVSGVEPFQEEFTSIAAEGGIIGDPVLVVDGRTSSAFLDAVEPDPDRPVSGGVHDLAPGLREALNALAMDFGPAGLRRAVELLYPAPPELTHGDIDRVDWAGLDVEFRAPRCTPVELPGGHFVNPDAVAYVGPDNNPNQAMAGAVIVAVGSRLIYLGSRDVEDDLGRAPGDGPTVARLIAGLIWPQED